MLKPKLTTKFKRDVKRLQKRGFDMEKLDDVVENYLLPQKALPPKYRDHALTGNYKGYRDCHIEPDWLLIYRVDGDDLVLLLSETGSHADLLG